MVTKESMRATMIEMNPETEIEISLHERAYNSIRNCAALLNSSMGRKYTVSVNWAENSCTVKRLS